MDIMTPEQRHNTMSRIRGKDTNPEVLVRKYLFKKGLRYRKNDRTLPGHPDLVFPKHKTVVFVNGCFWHGHEGCRFFVWPKQNADFWKNKIMSNISRDSSNTKKLVEQGWKVLVIWECELDAAQIDQSLSNLYTDIVNH